jgi:son of sevenless-like protein
MTSRWVASVILTVEDMNKRVLLVAKFILIAQRCKEINNFNAVMEIVSGLESSSIHRLQKTWMRIPQTAKTMLEELKGLMSQNGNFKLFRTTLKNATPPCLPYLGVYLTDLVFIEDGNPNTSQNLIYFTKRKQVANVIREIQQYQQTPYYFEPVPKIQNWLKTLKPLDDKELYSLSLVREPRESSEKD